MGMENGLFYLFLLVKFIVSCQVFISTYIWSYLVICFHTIIIIIIIWPGS